MKKFGKIFAWAFALPFLSAHSAEAATYIFDLSSPGVGAAQGVYGNINVTNNGSGLFTIGVSLAPGFQFKKGVFNGQGAEVQSALVFELEPDNWNVSGVKIPINFSAVSATHFTELGKIDNKGTNNDDPPFSNQPFGIDWDHAIGCTINCATGWSLTNPTALSFAFTATPGTTQLAYNTVGAFPGKNIYFASDVSYCTKVLASGLCGGTVSTGSIGATLLSAVPEPSTWTLMMAGFGLIGFALRRQREYRDVAAIS